MNKVIILQGLPASGKSTYAKELVSEGYKRVNKDDLRAMVDNGKYSRKNEKLILEMRDMAIDLALIHGYNVVVDDTNFEKKHFKQISMLADINNADIDVIVFDTPLEECIKRDKERENSVGEEVLRSMYNRYIAPRKSQ
jgi:predicted kinase